MKGLSDRDPQFYSLKNMAFSNEHGWLGRAARLWHKCG